jgi:hypothetical protein
MALTRGQRLSLRLALLAAVNGGVYAAYVSAIRSAKARAPRFVADDGGTDYDTAVRRGYADWADSLRRPRGGAA